MTVVLPPLLVLTDRSQLPLGRSLRATMAACVEGGLTHVVLRELDLADGERAGLAAQLIDVGLAVIAAHHAVPGCIGVQMAAGQPLSTRWHGRSCHSAADVRRAARTGAAYVTLGPYAATPSKPGYGPPLPAEEYAAAPVPVFALGGISLDNAGAAVRAGATGIAVMGKAMRSADPAGLIAALLANLPEHPVSAVAR